jgi:tRNA U54 and U55 pseudouridine synthase Pus10
MNLLESARAVRDEGPICDACLGRVFAGRSHGLGNDERGRALRVTLAMIDDEPFDARAVAGQLHEEVLEIDPGADFSHVRVDGAAGAGTISKRLRSRAEQEDVTVVFIGSENAGRIITPVTSVAGAVAAAQAYDVHIVRQRLPTAPRERLPSEFFLVD